MTIKKRYFFILLLWLSLTNLLAQDYKVEKITSLNGLSQNDVQDIIQDSRGFVWIATNDGLNRYNGYEFQTYRIGDNGLKSNLILTIIEDKNHNLWIGTADRGLYLYNRKTDKFIHISELSPQNYNLLSGNVRKVFIDAQGNIWAYNADNGNLFKISFDYLNNKVKQIYTYLPGTKGYQKSTLNDLKLCDNGKICLAMKAGIFIYHPNQDIFTPIKNLAGESLSIAPISDCKAIVSVKKQLFLFDLKTHKEKLLKQLGAECKVFYQNENVWISTSNGVFIAHYDKLKEELGEFKVVEKYTGLINNTITSDRNGNLWFGFLKSGIHQYIYNQKPFILYGQDGSIGNGHILPFLIDPYNKIWIGTEGTGLYVVSVNKNNQLKTESRLLTDKTVYCFAYSKSFNKIYCGVENEPLYEIDPSSLNTKKKIISNQTIRTILSDSTYLWIGTYNDGLYRYHIPTGKSIHFVENGVFPSNIVRNFMRDKKGNIWVATDKGICIFSANSRFRENPAMNVIQSTPQQQHSITNNYVIPMIQTENGDVWIGTLGGGINVLSNLNYKFQFNLKSYSTQNGLSNNTIKALIEDNQGNIWASTNKGLNRINVHTNNILIYDNKDGLQDYEFNELSAIKRSDGQLMFGGVNGFNSFYPNQIIQDSTKPQLVLTDFLLFNKSILLDKNPQNANVLSGSISDATQIKLTHNQNSFTFVFSALHYVAPFKNQYLYKLEGFDDKWIKANSANRMATYTNTPPGKYRFLLKGSNGDGVWNDKELVIEVIISPPLWATWYAYILYVIIAVLGGVALQSYFRQKQMRKNDILIANLEKKRTQELLEMKTQFFTNISHEFRTPLTLILSPLQKLVADRESLSNSTIVASLNSMLHNGNVLLKLINELLNFSKNEKGKLQVQLTYGNFAKFSRYVFSQFNFVAEQKQVQLIYHTTALEINFCFDSSMMEQVMYNLLSNALKHTPVKGTVSFNVMEEKDEVIFSISDTGKGISKELENHLFERFFSFNANEATATVGTGIGLFLTKSQIEMHGGSITMNSQQGKGTIFTVVLPKNLNNTPSHQEVENEDENFNENVELLLESENLNNSPVEEKCSLLIVDDNYEITQVLSDLFRDDYKIIVAEDGEEAWMKTVENFPDIIISDVTMPVMDGLELCEKVKKDIRTSHIPVVLLTARASEKDQIRGYKSQADAYCPKPFDNEVLTALIMSILRNRQISARNFKQNISITPAEITTTSSDEKFIQKLLKVVEDNMANSELTVEDLGQAVGMNPHILNKKLKSLINTTANTFIRTVRMKRAGQLLKLNRYSIADVTYEVGFNDLKYFRECFIKEFGMSPSKYKEQFGKKEQIEP